MNFGVLFITTFTSIPAKCRLCRLQSQMANPIVSNLPKTFCQMLKLIKIPSEMDILFGEGGGGQNKIAKRWMFGVLCHIQKFWDSFSLWNKTSQMWYFSSVMHLHNGLMLSLTWHFPEHCIGPVSWPLQWVISSCGDTLRTLFIRPLWSSSMKWSSELFNDWNSYITNAWRTLGGKVTCAWTANKPWNANILKLFGTLHYWLHRY